MKDIKALLSAKRQARSNPFRSLGRARSVLSIAALVQVVAGDLLVATSAFAMEAHGEHASAAHHADIASLLWPGINFILFVALARYAYGKAILPALAARHQSMQEGMVRAQQILEAATTDFDEVAARLSGIEREQREIKEDMIAEAIRTADSVVEAARKQAEQMKRDLAVRVQQEERQAAAEIRRQVIVEATRIARRRLQTEISEEEDRRLRSSAVQGLGQ